jgi:hypothetical protein
MIGGRLDVFVHRIGVAAGTSVTIIRVCRGTNYVLKLWERRLRNDKPEDDQIRSYWNCPDTEISNTIMEAISPGDVKPREVRKFHSYLHLQSPEIQSSVFRPGKVHCQQTRISGHMYNRTCRYGDMCK